MCCCGLLGGCCAGLCAGCCTSLQECRIKHGMASRIPYIFIMFIFSVFAVFMSLYGERVFYQIHLFHFKLTICNSSSCEGNGSVYRTSFALFIFFILHALLIIVMESFQWIFFGCKLLFLIGFLTATFWIPNTFFDGYAEFARVASAIFLVLQVIILISWAWDINDCIVGKIGNLQDKQNNVHDIEQEKKIKIKVKSCQCLLISITLIIIAAIIILFVFLFRWFDKNSTCHFNEAIISISIVLVFLAIVIPPLVQYGSLFTASVVGFYMTYLCYTALTSYPQTQCNVFANKRNTATLWIGIVLTAVTVSYLGFNASRHNLLASNETVANDDNNDDIELQIPKSQKQKAIENENNNANDDDDDDDDDTKDLKDCNGNDHAAGNEEGKKSQDSNYKNERRSNVFFHLSMAFAAVYMCMLYTNWGTDVVSTSKANERGRVSLWVNIGSQWTTFILFIWTIIAPKICPQRFGIENIDY